jgi:release factor glutamine methyltransferase
MAEFHRLRHRDEVQEDNNLYHHHHHHHHHGWSASYDSSTSSSPLTWEDLNEDAEILAKQAQQQQATNNNYNSASNMPRLDHLSLRDYDEVYEPSDDTYLLLDAIQYEFQNGTFDEYFKKITANNDNDNNKQTTVVLEIGCGTGVASVFFRSQWIKRWETLLYDDNDVDVVISSSRSDTSGVQTAADLLSSYATDINPKAIQVTLQTDSYNNGHVFHEDVNPIRVVQCDLATDLTAQLKGKVDVLLFNPPYVPTEDSEVVDLSSNNNSTVGDNNNDKDTAEAIITAAWAGGKDGRRVVDRAIPQIAQLLRRPNNASSRTGTSSKIDDDDTTAGGITTTSSADDEDGSCTGGGGGGDTGGVVYLVTVDDNRPAQLASQLSASLSLEMKPLFRRRARNEFLTIQKITWEQQQPSAFHPNAKNDQPSTTGTEQQTMSESASSSLLS